MSRVDVDTSKWPVVWMNFPPEVTPQDLSDLYVSLNSCAQRGRHVQVVDFTKNDPLKTPATVRTHAASLEREFIAQHGSVVIGEAYIVKSALSRGILTAYHWLRGHAPWPTRMFAKTDDALDWAKGLLRKELGFSSDSSTEVRP